MQRVKAERERQFAAARNAEINASMAAVARARASLDYNRIETSSVCRPYNCKVEHGNQVATLSAAEYAAMTSHCVRAPQSPRCEAERIREFAAARNAEINASMAAVARARTSTTVAINTTHCTGYEATPRCEAERSRHLTLALTHCKSADDTSPRCTVERDREFHIARNAEIDRSMAAVASDRALQRHESAGRYSTGRNNSVNAALSAYGSANEPLETGAIGVPELPMEPGPTPARDLKLEHRSSNDPCRAAGTPLSPLQFSRGNTIDETMTPQLERLAEIAQTCPGVRIEVHGYSDRTGSTFHNRVTRPGPRPGDHRLPHRRRRRAEPRRRHRPRSHGVRAAL